MIKLKDILESNNIEELNISEKKKKKKRDKCYYKVKRRYKVWPSAYGSLALSACRKVGAANWGEGGKLENEEEKHIQDRKND
jgi:hypothetical protein